MSSPHDQFQELKNRLQDLRKDLDALESLVEIDIPGSLNKIRFVTEKVLHKLCTAQNLSWGHAEPTLERMIGPLLANGSIPRNIGIHVRTIQSNANPGSHYQEATLGQSHLQIAETVLLSFCTGT